jgi:tetratricopeptide (TPR) repeat protein
MIHTGCGSDKTHDKHAQHHYIPALCLVAVALGIAACGTSPNPSSTANALVVQGLHDESRGATQQAIRDFRSAASADRTDALPYYDLGVVYQRLHNPTQAATAYKHALSLRPTYGAAMFNLAIVDTVEQPQAAINLYNELMLQNPRDANAAFNLGLLLIADKQPVPGHVLLKKAVSLVPGLAKRLPPGVAP